jgi:hypothetical protein
MMCISGEKTEEMNNQQVSAGIPDEGGHERKQPYRISQLTNWEWLSKEYRRKNPRN